MCTASSPVMWTIGNNAKQQPVTLHLGGHNDPATIGILGLSHLTAPVVASLLQAIPTGVTVAYFRQAEDTTEQAYRWAALEQLLVQPSPLVVVADFDVREVSLAIAFDATLQVTSEKINVQVNYHTPLRGPLSATIY